MNIVREHINFTRGLDPKTAMNIGLANKRSFDNDKEVAEWLFMFPEICTEGSIKNWQEAVNKDWRIEIKDRKQFDVSLKLQIVKWIKMNIHFDTEYMGLKEAKTIFDLLEAIVEEQYINESFHFKRGLNPKTAMDIGMVEQWKKYLKTVANYDCVWVYNRDFKNIYCGDTYDDYASYIVRIIYHTISNIIYAKMPPQAAFEKLCEDEDIKKITIFPGDCTPKGQNAQKVKRKIAEILVKKFHITVNPDFEDK